MNESNTYQVVYKEEGKTPLEIVEQFKKTHTQYRQAKIAYAGRLDPMAHGYLLLLIGEECRKRDKYLSLDKEYYFEVLLGFESDTHDILGLARASDIDTKSIPTKKIKRVINKLAHRKEFPYPIFSSKTVEGKPLFEHALEGNIDEINIPTKRVDIYRLDYLERYTISGSDLQQNIHERIKQVTQVRDARKELGRDFRRKEVLQTWDELLVDSHQDEYSIIRVRCIASSGAYMRTLAHLIGEHLGTTAIAWSIQRTQIGRYQPLLCWGYWKRKYVN